MEEEKSNNNKELTEKITLGLGITALSVGAGALGYKITEFLSHARKNNPYTNNPHYKKIDKLVLKETSLELKVEKLRDRIESNVWTDQVGAFLYIFSELELYIDAIIFKLLEEKKLDINNHFKNKLRKGRLQFFDKIQILKKNQVIEKSEFQTMNHIISHYRNHLAHGDFNNIDVSDIRNSFTFMAEFLIRHQYNYMGNSQNPKKQK